MVYNTNITLNILYIHSDMHRYINYTLIKIHCKW